jgi:hypothetical protein
MAERLHPGVYVDEVSSGVRPIEAVGTSTAAFVGEAARGMPAYPHFVTSPDEYTAIFGGDAPGEKGFLAQAVQAFFNAGGQRAFVVRVLPGDALHGASTAVATRIEATVLPAAGAPNALSFTAKGAGAWSSSLRIDVDASTHFPNEAFKIVVSSVDGGGLRTLETFDDVRTDPKHEDYFADVVNRTSKYVTVTDELLKDALADAPTKLAAPERAPTAWLAKATPDKSGTGTHYTVYEDSVLTLRWRDLGSDADPIEGKLDVNAVVKASAAKTFTTGAANLTPKELSDAIKAITGFRVVDHPDATTSDATVAGVQPAVATRPYLYITVPAAGLDLTGLTVNVALTVTGSAAQSLALASAAKVTAAQLQTLISDAVKGNVGIDRVAVRGDVVVIRGAASTKGVALDLTVTGGADPFATAKLALPGHDGAVVDHLENVELTISETRNPAAPPVLRSLGLSARATGYDEGSAANPALRPVATSKLRISGGTDGSTTTALTADDYAGDATDGTGLHALDHVEVNLVALPGKNAPGFITKGLAYCDARGDCFFIADGPGSVAHDFDMSAAEAKQFVEALPSRSKNAAIYFPWVEVSDPVGVGRNPTRFVPPSGQIAGIYARTDRTRGVWKAPAGLEAGLAAALDVQVNVRDADQDLLNPVSLNCVRKFPGSGLVAWGARTLSSDPEWRYVPVRRTALFLKESLRRGLQWAVFEPNDDRLWDQMRSVATSFMLGLFRQGAFQGTRPDEAFLVVCDRSTNPQVLVDQGIVTLRVAFAPLKPAEFVVIELSQKSLVG